MTDSGRGGWLSCGELLLGHPETGPPFTSWPSKASVSVSGKSRRAPRTESLPITDRLWQALPVAVAQGFGGSPSSGACSRS